MKRLLPILTILLFSVTLGSSSIILAQETLPPTPPVSTVSITAIPPRLELEALPGATLQETLKVRNESDTELALKSIVSDFIVINNKGTPVAVSEETSGRWSLASWITVSPAKILLQPKQTQAVDLIIQIPEDALAGGHYAMITYQPITEGLIGQKANGTSGGSAIQPQVGTLTYLNVIGDITEAAFLKEFQVDAKFKEYGPASLSAEIQNLGDIHLRPKGQVTITNLLNKTVAVLPLEEKNIFPFASRTYDFIFGGKWHLGRYAARLNATAGDSQIPLHGLIYFWIVPWKELTAATLALIILIVITAKLLRKKKAQSEPQAPDTNTTPPDQPPTT
jgi:hypothetical protein